MHRRLWLSGGLVIGIMALTFSACSGGGGAGGGGAASGAQNVTLGAADYQFTPSTFTAKAGQPIQLTLRNTATQVHDFTIDNVGGKQVQAIAQPTQSGSVTFTVPTAGTYTFYCSQPGHRELGMQGTLTVQ